jgi:hypothetical protein
MSIEIIDPPNVNPQRSCLGRGAKKNLQDEPQYQTEHGGFTLRCGEPPSCLWSIHAEGFNLPKQLEGKFTNLRRAREAVDAWNNRNNLKGDME